jgi:hypothetical protein
MPPREAPREVRRYRYKVAWMESSGEDRDLSTWDSPLWWWWYMVLIGCATLPGNGRWAMERGQLVCASDKDNLDKYLDGDEETQARLVDDGIIKFKQAVYSRSRTSKHPGPGCIRTVGRLMLSKAIPAGSYKVDGMTVKAFAFYCWECEKQKCRRGKLRRFAMEGGKVTEY